MSNTPIGVTVRRIDRTTFPSSPAHRALHAFVSAMHDNHIKADDLRAAMLWFLGYEECDGAPQTVVRDPLTDEQILLARRQWDRTAITSAARAIAFVRFCEITQKGGKDAE